MVLWASAHVQIEGASNNQGSSASQSGVWKTRSQTRYILNLAFLPMSSAHERNARTLVHLVEARVLHCYRCNYRKEDVYINQPDTLRDFFFQCISRFQGSESVSAIRECQVSEVWLTMAELKRDLFKKEFALRVKFPKPL